MTTQKYSLRKFSCIPLVGAQNTHSGNSSAMALPWLTRRMQRTCSSTPRGNPSTGMRLKLYLLQHNRTICLLLWGGGCSVLGSMALVIHAGLGFALGVMVLAVCCFVLGIILVFWVLWGAGIAQWLERRTLDRNVAGSNPSWSGGRIFFSRVNFLC